VWRRVACHRRALLPRTSPMPASAPAGPQRDRRRFGTWRSVDRTALRRKRKERPSAPGCRNCAFPTLPRSPRICGQCSVCARDSALEQGAKRGRAAFGSLADCLLLLRAYIGEGRSGRAMTNIRNVLFLALACAVAIPASGMAAANGVPGGITLVPGTVVIPGAGGSAVTGTVPLAGTTGSPGVGNFDPGLAPPNRGT